MKIVDFVVCDDIRQEIRNKLTLVGVYGDTINLDSPEPEKVEWPIVLKLGVMARLLFEKGETALEGTKFQAVLSLNEKELLRVDGVMSVLQTEKQLVAIPLNLNVPMPGPGILRFKIKFEPPGMEPIELIPDLSVQLVLRKVLPELPN